MPSSLGSRVARAKAAQAKRIGSATKKRKRCKKGKSCGFSCIAGGKMCLVDLDPSISDDVGKAAKTIRSRPKPKKEERDSGRDEAIKQHFKENSFKLPDKSFNGEDVANLLNTAANDLDGEARANVDKLRDFILRDKTGLMITETLDTYKDKHGGKDKANEKAKSWALSPSFLSLLDRTFGVNTGNNFSEIKAKMEEGIVKMRVTIESLRKAIEDVEKFGGNASGERGLLAQLTKKLADGERGLKELPLRIGGFALGTSYSDGWTMPKARFVTLHEDSVIGHDFYNRNRGIDARAMQQSVATTMDRRAKATNPEAAEVKNGTFHFSSGYGADKMPKDSRNEQILFTFTHEMGHQIHFRSGESQPPPNLPSMSRTVQGITEYATMNHKELFAEAFVAYTFNPAALRQQDQALYNWIDSSVKTALANAGSAI